MDLYDIAIARKLSSGGGGGGGSWTVLMEETVTAETGPRGNLGELSYESFIDAETVKITFNGTEYECTRIDVEGNSVYGGFGESGPDFSEYPFAFLSSLENFNMIYTESAGTYTVKIEVPPDGK